VLTVKRFPSAVPVGGFDGPFAPDCAVNASSALPCSPSILRLQAAAPFPAYVANDGAVTTWFFDADSGIRPSTVLIGIHASATAIRRTECVAVRSSHARLRSSYAPLILRSAWPAFAPPAPLSPAGRSLRSNRNGPLLRRFPAVSLRLTSLPRSSAGASMSPAGFNRRHP
jgi:hypothetical protein